MRRFRGNDFGARLGESLFERVLLLRPHLLRLLLRGVARPRHRERALLLRRREIRARRSKGRAKRRDLFLFVRAAVRLFFFLGGVLFFLANREARLQLRVRRLELQGARRVRLAGLARFPERVVKRLQLLARRLVQGPRRRKLGRRLRRLRGARERRASHGLLVVVHHRERGRHGRGNRQRRQRRDVRLGERLFRNRSVRVERSRNHLQRLFAQSAKKLRAPHSVRARLGNVVALG
mmetsp:Transcript_12800/g.53619  ORF Transcript_12800/g.53619 Transcript_12800/m.53619 type:complete len:236 (-) Transcript_12800:2536-3243(-)